jgi:hypothetical protein
MCLLRYGPCSCDFYSRCYMWLPRISTQLSALHLINVHILWKLIISLESPERHSLLVAVIPLSHWWPPNTQKPLGVPTAKSSNVLRSGDLAGQFFIFFYYWWGGTNKGMVRADMSKPALIFFTARVHTTKSTVKMLAANTHCKYFLKIAEVTHFSVRGTACTRDLYNPHNSCDETAQAWPWRTIVHTLLENLTVTTVRSG